MIKRLAIIPARIGSKRVKQKNIKKIGSKTLIESTLDILKKSKFFHTIHVSTDSEKIKKLTEKKKLLVDFMRPKSLSKDKVPVSDVINFVIKSFKKMNINFEEVWLIYASNPFLSIKHIKKGYKLYKQNKGEFSIMTVSNYNYPINWALKLSENFTFFNFFMASILTSLPNGIKPKLGSMSLSFCSSMTLAMKLTTSSAMVHL